MKNVIIAIALILAACDTNHRIFRDGKDGTAGQAGSSCHVTQGPTNATITCDDGSTATVSNGQNGLTGATGANGSSCSVMAALDGSGALISCQDGSNVFVKNGEKGDTGATGAAGMNATSVEFVKFCNSANPSYGSFPEYGMRVGTKIYAVYSANNGFLTLLSPGTYVTTSTGLNCNFTVNNDGTVSN